MTGRGRGAVVFVLLDAFRHDYVSRTRFLRRLATTSATGALEEPFGFCPRAAYFGGLTVAEQGFTNLFRYAPDTSPFGWARHAHGTSSDDALAGRLRAALVARARARLPEFAAAYADPLEIPLHALGLFDISEREAPWSPAAGYRSLFHILDEDRQPWLQVSWPYAGWRGALTNRRVAGEALQRLRPDHRFAFVHLPELDAIGHAHGPGSAELQAALDETDRLCELLCAAAAERFDDPIIVFAGDHGMLPVVRTADPIRALNAAGLAWGHDLVYFVDSTMVRCWYATEAAAASARAALERLDAGHWLDRAERARWEIEGIDPSNGDDYFLADPGIVFSPSFFDSTGRRVPRGMHGYAPDVADNRGALIVHRPRTRDAGPLGVVAAARLFPSFLEWLGYDAAAFTPRPPVRPEPRFVPRWSAAGTPETDVRIDAHLETAVDELRRADPELEAIAIAGGFGRGEGTIDGDRPANDYDIVVVGSAGNQAPGAGDSLAARLGIDFVDLWVRPDLTPSEPISQFDFDLRYGSRLLWGDPLAIEALPLHAPESVRVDEGAFALGSRSGGLLLGLTGYSGAGSADAFLGRQLSKFLIAAADCWLMAIGDYHVSYRVRQPRFHALAPAAGFSRATVAGIDLAFDIKLGFQPSKPESADNAAQLAVAALDELERVLGWCDSGLLEQRAGAVAAARCAGADRWFERIEQFGVTPRGEFAAEATAALYAACIAGVRSWPAGAAARAAAIRSPLSPFFAVDVGDADVPQAAARAWLALFH